MTAASSDQGESKSFKQQFNKQWNKRVEKTYYELQSTKELRIVLLGKTGQGKSSLGNSICGAERFNAECSSSSVTRRCFSAERRFKNRNLVVIDTPGFFDTDYDNQTLLEEIIKCFTLTTPGPHAFLLVMSVCRQTQENQQTLTLIEKVFGPNVLNYCIIVFTGEDFLKKKTIEEYLENAPDSIRHFVERCPAYMTINNEENNKEKLDEKVEKLIHLIDDMIKANGNKVFTNQNYMHAEKALRDMEEKEMEKIKEEERKKVIREMEEKHNKEKENLEKGLALNKEQLQDLILQSRRATRDEITGAIALPTHEVQLMAQQQKKQENTTRFETFMKAVPSVVDSVSRVLTTYLETRPPSVTNTREDDDDYFQSRNPYVTAPSDSSPESTPDLRRHPALEFWSSPRRHMEESDSDEDD